MHGPNRRPSRGWMLAAALALAPPLLATEPPRGRSLLERLDQIVEEARTTHQVPGIAVAIQHGDRLVLARGYGLADVENGAPATEHTIFRIGSVTKQYTAAAIVRLAEQGKLRLDDPIEGHLDGVPTGGFRITVAQLLDHTSGYKGYTEMPEFWGKARQDLGHDEMVKLFTGVPFEFEPGDRFQYNNSAYYLAGMLIERVAGVTYAEYLRRELLDPLGLRETFYLYDAPIVPGRAEGYRLVEGELRNDEPLSMHLPYAAGALGASVLDLVRWQGALVAGRVVSPEGYRRMTTPVVLRGGDTYPYGLGLFMSSLDGHRKVHHAGGINGFLSQLAYYPDDQLHIAVLCNAESAQPGALENRLARAMLGLPEPVVTPVAITEAELQRYAGSYQPGRSPFVFTVRDGALFANGARLVAVGNHRFVAADDPDRTFTFEVTRDQAVSVVAEREGATQAAPRVE